MHMTSHQQKKPLADGVKTFSSQMTVQPAVLAPTVSSDKQAAHQDQHLQPFAFDTKGGKAAPAWASSAV